MIKPGPQKFQLKLSSNHHVVSYFKVWACNINNSTEAAAYEEIRRVFSFFSFITWRKYDLYICAVEWTSAWIQLCQYKPLYTFALFCSFGVFFLPLDHFQLHVATSSIKMNNTGKSWSLVSLVQLPYETQLYSEIFRPTFNPINRSFPCACIHKTCVFF